MSQPMDFISPITEMGVPVVKGIGTQRVVVGELFTEDPVQGDVWIEPGVAVRVWSSGAWVSLGLDQRIHVEPDPGNGYEPAGSSDGDLWVVLQ